MQIRHLQNVCSTAMRYADLIQQRLQALSPAQQAQVFDFVEFLASRRAAAAGPATAPTGGDAGRLPMWLDPSQRVPAFVPMSRDEANARDQVEDTSTGLPTQVPPDAP